ncbi:MAG: rhomboid family intramembrane serine protease [Chlamydiales bacterium]|nr:rhomboid family intramembrane serine protease [Chlamydiales bacterium]
MRLVGTVENELDATVFVTSLQQEGIAAGFDHIDGGVQIWVESEDDLERASEYLEAYKKAPTQKRFIKAKAKPTIADPDMPRVIFNPILTKIIMGICVFFFFWSWLQEVDIEKKDTNILNVFKLTPIAQYMLYDYPETYALMQAFINQYPVTKKEDLQNLPPAGKALFKKAEETPYWKGIYEWLLTGNETKAVMFEKIRQGQYWRLISPVVLHGNILHILFNMLWLWLLGKMCEMRMRPLRFLLLMFIIGVISNTAQYLMSGPFFIGYSGIITGLAGYIFVRQKKAPWEGYPLPKSTLLFLFIFIFGMALLGVVDFILQKNNVHFFPMQLANTAHIVGLFVGAACAFIPYFSQRRKA